STPRTLRRPCRTEPSQSSNRSPSKPSLESPRFERPSRTCYPSSRSVLLPIMPVRTIAPPALRVGAGQSRRGGAGIDQHVETRIEQVESKAAFRAQMAQNARQALPLQVDGQQVLEGAEGHEHKAEAPTQIEGRHVLIDERQTLLRRGRKARAFAPRN